MMISLLLHKCSVHVPVHTLTCNYVLNSNKVNVCSIVFIISQLPVHMTLLETTTLVAALEKLVAAWSSFTYVGMCIAAVIKLVAFAVLGWVVRLSWRFRSSEAAGARACCSKPPNVKRVASSHVDLLHIVQNSSQLRLCLACPRVLQVRYSYCCIALVSCGGCKH